MYWAGGTRLGLTGMGGKVTVEENKGWKTIPIRDGESHVTGRAKQKNRRGGPGTKKGTQKKQRKHKAQVNKSKRD